MQQNVRALRGQLYHLVTDSHIDVSDDFPSPEHDYVMPYLSMIGNAELGCVACNIQVLVVFSKIQLSYNREVPL